MSIEIIPVDNKKIDKSFIDTRKLLNYIIPSYNEMVKDMVFDLKKNVLIYPKHYKSLLKNKF